MDKQIKYLLGLLILLLISAYFISLLGGLPQYFKDDIIAFLEQRSGGEISIGSISLWPLNRIRIDQFEFTAESGSSFKARALNLDYSLNFREAEIIKVEFIELLEAEIEVQEELVDLTSGPEADQEAGNDSINADFLSEFSLPRALSDLKVNIRDSNLNLKSAGIDLELTDLQLGLSAEAEDIYTLNLSTAANLNQLQLDDGSDLDNLNLNRLELQLVREEAETSLYYSAEDFDLKAAAETLPESNFEYQDFNLDLKTLAGTGSGRGEIYFKDYSLQDYQSEFEIKDLELQSSYSSGSEQSEKINLTAPNLNIQLQGPELKLSLPENEVFIDQNPVDFSFEWNQSQDYNLKAQAEDFDFNYQFLSPYLKEGNFDFDFQLSAENNQLEKAAAEISAAELNSDYLDLNTAEISLLLDGQELFLNKAEFMLADQNQLSLKGSYNLDENNYLLSAEAEDFIITESMISDLAQLEYFRDNDYLDRMNDVQDRRLNFKFDSAGLYGAEEDLSLSGDLNLAFTTAEHEADFEIDSSFWYTDSKLLLNSLKVNSDYGRLDLMGEMDFDSEEMQFRYAARNFEAVLLNEFLEEDSALLSEINPEVDYMEGSISNTFARPEASIRLEMAELEYDDYLLEDINLSAVYAADNLEIKDLKAEIAQAEIAAAGDIKNISRLGEAELDLEANSQNLYFQDIADFSSQDLPVSGEIQLQALLSGTLADYDLDLRINAFNSLLQLDGEEIEFSRLQAEISRTNGDFVVENLIAEQQNLKLEADGRFNLEQGFDIDLSLTGFEPADYLNTEQYAAADIGGSLSLNGKLSGGLDSAVFDFEFDSEELSFADFDLSLDDNSLRFMVNENRILIDQFNFTVDSGSYNLSGQIFDLDDEPESELKLELLEVPTRELTLKFIDFYPLSSDLIFEGAVDFKSQGQDYQAQLDISANSESGQGTFNINGEVDDNLALDFEGSDIGADFSSRQYDFNLNLKSLVDFDGTVEGSLDSPVVRLSHQLRELSVNNNRVELIEGEILLESSRRFSISESINFRRGGSLKADGSYSIIDEELNLSTNLEELPLGFLISFLGEDYSASGQIDGSFRAEGSLDSPELSGDLDLKAETVEMGLTDPIEDLTAGFNLQEEQVVIETLKGRFAEGSFNGEGSVNLLDFENAWDLSLEGQKLYFEHGSLAGDFDSELTFTGPLSSPLLQGDLLVYDFVIGIPFEWPENEAGPDAFVPRIDLDISPGENVTVEDENMEILVENGDLNLQFDNSLEDPLAMEGRLRSQEGTFTYYNSRFEMENAEAVFTPVDEGDIPDLNVNANTYAGGNEININVTGPADDMRISLSSDTDLTEEEILNLLSTRGALGSAIIGGEDIGIQNIIWQELVRVVNSFLQRDVFSDLESDVETIFSLDRAEIDAFQYGMEREFAIYLGKNITDKLYLEYASFFDEEGREGEISFQYKLADPTVLKGTYYGDEEYQISIETEIEF